jgi:hypothetical protein
LFSVYRKLFYAAISRLPKESASGFLKSFAGGGRSIHKASKKRSSFRKIPKVPS